LLEIQLRAQHQDRHVYKETNLVPRQYRTQGMLMSVIEVAEGIDVATCDIPNAFIQTEVQEVDKDGNRIIMEIQGILVDLLVKVFSEYEAIVIQEGSGKVLYVRVKKAIYGMLESVLLFYKNLSGDLVKYGFDVNPYDPCVANKSCNQIQLTVSWHVDDLKISHHQEKVVSDFICWIKEQYGKNNRNNNNCL
jgi:hypothetical protein